MKKYPEPICQHCGKKCDQHEEIPFGDDGIELWCYCEDCCCGSYHPIPEYKTDYSDL